MSELQIDDNPPIPPRKVKVGRPSTYKLETVEAICAELVEGRTLKAICSRKGMPQVGTVLKWLASGQFPEFEQLYSRAREAQAERLFDEIITIADTPKIGVREKVVETPDGTRRETVRDDMIEHRRLQIDTRKWAAAKMLPKRYGDFQRIDLEAKISLGDMISALDQVADKGKTIEGTVNAAPADIDAEPGEG